MANNAVWQVLHFLCILAHIGMLAAGIVTFIVNAVGGSSDMPGGGGDAFRNSMIHSVYPWAVGAIVSYSPNNSTIE